VRSGLEERFERDGRRRHHGVGRGVPVALLFALLFAHQAPAFWFKGGERQEPAAAESGPRRGEVIVATLTEEQATQFMQLAAARAQTDQQIQVLGDLRAEKRKEIASFEANLQRNFDVNATNAYHYDRANRVVYLLEAVPTAETNVTAAVAAAAADGGDAAPAGQAFRKTVWKELSQQEGDAFERILSAKQVAVTQLQSIELLLREKGLERRRAQELLQSRFGIDPALHYRYDRNSRTLYRSISTKE
jgi:hypothetical protein